MPYVGLMSLNSSLAMRPHTRNPVSMPYVGLMSLNDEEIQADIEVKHNVSMPYVGLMSLNSTP